MIVDCISEIEYLKIEDGSFLVVKIGSDDRPASTQDIEDVQNCIKKLNMPKLRYLVTHHLVDFQVIKVCEKE